MLGMLGMLRMLRRGQCWNLAPRLLQRRVQVQPTALAPSSKKLAGEAPQNAPPVTARSLLPQQQPPSTASHHFFPPTTNAAPWTRMLTWPVPATLLITTQPLIRRAARVAEPHGEEADEGIHERTQFPSPMRFRRALPCAAERRITPPHGTLMLLSDVLQPRAAMFRQLR